MTETVVGCDLSNRSFSRLAEFVTAELGIKMPETKYSMVQSRLLRRVRELRLGSVEEYADYLFAEADPAEREEFVNAITTNKTDFFREPRHFEFLTQVALPSIERTAGHVGTFRIWSAGCSSGEEPYTLAMVLQQYVCSRPGRDFAILATDVSTRVLEHARAGIYTESQIAPVPPELRRKFLAISRDPAERRVRVIPQLRQKISFYRLNFMEDEYSIRDVFDAVFFRNVMIYFDRETQASVIRKICRRLAPGGYLFVGHSESLAGLDIPVETVQASIFRKPM